MDSALHRIEALPGAGRFAVTFRQANGTEQTATVRVEDVESVARAGLPPDIDVAEASLPAGWRRDGDAFAVLVAAVQAVAAAAMFAPPQLRLLDVDGGWDVSLGNVVLNDDGRPTCIAHGTMTADAGHAWSCAECGATALFRS